MNHLALSARSAPATKLAFEADLRTSMRKALQFGRAELVSTESGLGQNGFLARPTDVVVAAKTRVPQLAMELQWHPRGEDHVAFANAAIGDLVKMVVARAKGAVEQGTVLVCAPSRFWRWLPAYAEDRLGYELLGPQADTPVSVKSEFLTGPTWDPLFQDGVGNEVPERLWASLMATADLRSPWSDTELRLLDVKGLGSLTDVRR